MRDWSETKAGRGPPVLALASIYFTFPHAGPSHLALKFVFPFIVRPLPAAVVCPEPFTLSGLTVSRCVVPLAGE